MNVHIISGRVSKEPYVLKDGLPVIRFSVATLDFHKTKSGELREAHTEHDVVYIGKRAAWCLEKLKRGDHVNVQGRVQHNVIVLEDGERIKEGQTLADDVNLVTR